MQPRVRKKGSNKAAGTDVSCVIAAEERTSMDLLQMISYGPIFQVDAT
jgi:hypothetical protein